MSFILLGILNSQVESAAGGAYELIESNILTSSASSVTFSSIPQDYKHLQIRSVALGTGGNLAMFRMRFNSDTGSNYAWHRLRGDGSSVSSAAGTSQSYIEPLQRIAGSSGNSTSYSAAIIDILDYAVTTKNKTTRTLGGHTLDSNFIFLNSGLWLNTSAISALELFVDGTNNFVSGSRFSLYGIRG